MGNDAAAVCAKHGERLAHRIREHSHILPGTSQGVGIAAVLENEHPQRGDHGGVCDKPVGHVRNRLGFEAGAVEDADQPGQPFGDRTICFSKWGALPSRKAKKQFPQKQPQTRSKAARAHIAEGTRLFALAGRPTKAQFVKVYGPQGPKMTWEQRAKAGVDAKHFQAALAAKGGS